MEEIYWPRDCNYSRIDTQLVLRARASHVRRAAPPAPQRRLRSSRVDALSLARRDQRRARLEQICP